MKNHFYFWANLNIGDTREPFILFILLLLFIGIVAPVFTVILILKPEIDKYEKFYSSFLIYRCFICFAFAYWLGTLGILIFKQYNLNYYLALKIKVSQIGNLKNVILKSIIFTLFVVVLMLWNFYYNINNIDKPNYPALIFFICMISMVVLPVNIISRSARWRLAKIFGNIISPFGKVNFLHELVADIITSFMRILVDFINTLCWIFNGNWISSTSGYCFSNETYLNSLVVLPMFFRFFMCSRQFYMKKKWSYFFNALKYLLTIIMGIIVCIHQGEFKDSQIFLMGYCGLVTFYNLFWDFKYDHNLFDIEGPFLLRKKRLYPVHFYYIWILINLMFRFNWMMLFFPDHYTAKYLYNINWVILYSSICEMIRRFIWVLIRVENEVIKHPESYGEMVALPPINMQNNE